MTCSTTWSPVLKIFNMFKTILMNCVVGYHPTSCHWIQVLAHFQEKIPHYLAYPSCEWISTILRISAQKHVSRLDYYAIVFISMLHQQPWEPFTLPSFVHIWNTQSLWDPHLCKDIDTLESVQRFTTKICTKSWNTNYQYRLGKLRLQTLNMRRSYLKQCHLYKLVHTAWSVHFSYSPITTSSSHSYPTCSNHNLYPACTCAKRLSNRFCPSVCLSVSQSSEKFWNLNIDRVKRFPKLTAALIL